LPLAEDLGEAFAPLPFDEAVVLRPEGDFADDLDDEVLEVAARPLPELLPAEDEDLPTDDDLPDDEERDEEADFLDPALLFRPEDDLPDVPRPDDELDDFLIISLF
jgi:hypothetical protein